MKRMKKWLSNLTGEDLTAISIVCAIIAVICAIIHIAA